MNARLLSRAHEFTLGSPWRLAATAFGIAVIVLLAGYWHTVETLTWVWGHDGTYQYAFLIFPLGLWVAWSLRREVRAHAPVPSVWGVAAVAVLAGVWYVGRMLDVNLLQHFAFVAMFPALVLACWGWRVVWTLIFPLAYLVVFAVPWGDGMVGPLQDITARFAVHALDLTGIPVLLNGREIDTPSATWMVAQACSGVKFFIACTALGCLYAYLMYHRWWKRVAFVVLAAIVPIIANGLRVYFTVLIGETFGLHYATGTDHMIFGWQFFGTVLVLLLLAGWFFRDPLAAPAPNLPRAAGPLSGGRGAVWLAAFALLVAAPIAAARLVLPVPSAALQLTAPTLAGWSGPHPATSGWRPSFKGAAGSVLAEYRSDAADGSIELFHAIYTGQPRKGHTLITYGNDVYDPARGTALAAGSRRIDLADATGITAGEYRLAESGGSRLVWYWYCIDHHCTASPIMAKLMQAWDVLRGHAPRSSVWALSSAISANGIEPARAHLLAFARTLPITLAGAPVPQRAAIAGDRP